MNASFLLDNLNEKQQQAVSAPSSQNLLVLAGAGSGKTRVLVHRIGWLMEQERISAYGILAVTFTNKAAREMRSRIEQLIKIPAQGMWMGTFHGLAHRLLRTHYEQAGLPEHFQILDSDDQYRLIRRVLKSLNMDEKYHPPKQIQWFINHNKDEGLRAEHVDHGNDTNKKQMLEVYRVYQDVCQRSGLVDFAELLMRAHQLWVEHPELLNYYRDRFKVILVDEFQDTNSIQYAWLRLLSHSANSMMIVGDDDQSIYGWRGAKIENIQSFTHDLPNVQTIRLEQNYRSTATILNAANTVIAHNSNRLGKQLWTDSHQGESIALYAALNELDEARFVASQIKEWLAAGNALNDCAILYRSNAQSRVFEEALLQEAIAYRIYGGLRFFERQEIKDVLAYLRLILQPNDDAAFERVVNTPTRGIGETTLSKIRMQAREQQQPLWQTSLQMIERHTLSGRAANALGQFIDLIHNLQNNSAEMPLDQQVSYTMNASGLHAMYESDRGEKAQARLDNLQELINACKEYIAPEEAENMSPLAAFLAHATLESGETQADDFQDSVKMMTMHTAKGLEFPLVFLVGIEEGMFPSAQSREEAGRLEEERRLCYVAMTRAMQKLYISHAESRRVYGEHKYQRPSRFIKEIPADCLQEVRLRTTISRPVANRFSKLDSGLNTANAGFGLGERVVHNKFGVGMVVNYEGSGSHTRIQVNFDDLGSKWLMLEYAKLERE